MANPGDILVALWWCGVVQNSNHGLVLAHLQNAVGWAYGKAQTDGDVNREIFGIFVAPEYLFMNSPTRSFTEADKDIIVARLKALSAAAPGMLIVPGTVIWRKPGIRPANQQHKKDPVTRSRTGPLKTSSREEKADRDTLWGDVLYEHAPLQDFTNTTEILRNTAYVLLNGEVRLKYNKKGNFHETATEGPDTIFVPGGAMGRLSIDRISFGIEICLDHNVGVQLADIGAGERPNIHIVCSNWVANNQPTMTHSDYFIHGSTNLQQSVVFHDPSRVPQPVPAGVQPCSTGNLGYHVINPVRAP